VPITSMATKYKAQKLAKSRFTWQNGLSLHRRTSLCWKLPADFREKLVACIVMSLDFEKLTITSEQNRKCR
jgi:hypothetical protein